MREQTGCGAQMPQNWSYGWEVPLTGGRVLFSQAEESTKVIGTQVGSSPTCTMNALSLYYISSDNLCMSISLKWTLGFVLCLLR